MDLDITTAVNTIKRGGDAACIRAIAVLLETLPKDRVDALLYRWREFNVTLIWTCINITAKVVVFSEESGEVFSAAIRSCPWVQEVKIGDKIRNDRHFNLMKTPLRFEEWI